MKKTSGFTLMELMVVIAITAILAAIAIPNLISWRSNYQLRGSAREVQSAINGARLAAIKENALVTVTFDAGARTIQTSVTNRSDSNAVPRTTTTRLRPTVQIASINFTSNPFRFNSRGLPITNANTNFASGRVRLSNAGGNSLDVIMASTGNTRIDAP
jgi:prepilin-type N-terminal cleavage/methylation domain-containing protein